MDVLSSQIDNFKIKNIINSRNNSFILNINNKEYFAKIILLCNKNYTYEKIIKTNNNIYNIYNSFIPKNIVLPLIKHNIFHYNKKLYQFILTKKVSGDLSQFNNQTEDFYINITYQVLNILYELLEEKVIYFDVKIQNFLLEKERVYITDFEDDYVKLLIWENKDLNKTIFTLQFYLFYLSFRSYYPDYSFFEEIRFFGIKEKILDFFLSDSFYEYLFEYLISNYSIFFSVVNKYLYNLKNKNEYDYFFMGKLKEKNYLKKIIV